VIEAMRILLVEDDRMIAEGVRKALRGEGFAVDWVQDGESALTAAGGEPYDLVLLDLGLPKRDGLDVLRAMRTRGLSMPVLIVTARDAVADRVKGLDAGADDYLVKPFDFGELLARVRALIRRGPSERPTPLEVGGLRADPVTRAVTWPGHATTLTPREFELLAFLLRRPGQTVPRQQLLDHVWGEGYAGSPNVVDVYVGYLRRKLDDPPAPHQIRTVRGVGFMLEPR
jgi:two-component system response regulator QseB